MEAYDITTWLDTAPPTQQEVFFAVCCSLNLSLEKAAVQKSLDVARKMTTATSVDEYLGRIRVSDFVDFATQERLKEEQTWRYKLFKRPLVFFGTKLFVYLFGLPRPYKVDDTYCADVGYGLLLGGLHLHLKQCGSPVIKYSGGEPPDER